MRVKGADQAGTVRWGAFGAVCVAYFAVTVGESVLAPLFPVLAGDLGIDLEEAGLALALLTAAIAVANVGGGYLQAWLGLRTPILIALGLVVLGGSVSAGADGFALFIVGQVLLGLGAGTFFAPGMQAAGATGGTARRGLVLGLFGIAFSAGLAAAAGLGVAGATVGWRQSFVAVAALAGLAAAAVALTPLPAPPPPVDGPRLPLRAAFGRATAAGSAAAVSQYGTVAFLPLFAVEVWGMSPGGAALVLVLARVLSVPAKTLAGHLSDARGPLPTLRGIGGVLVVSGALWLAAPSGAIGAVPAVVFAACVSGAFPVANVLALAEFAGRGPLLGTYRSAQMAVGAVAAGAIGAGGAAIGLRPVLLLTLAAPVALVALPNGARAGATGQR